STFPAVMTTPDQTGDSDGATMKVLIVDDNPAMRRLIRRMVLSPADDCFECADGAEALAAYEAHQLDGADWVLMDVEMAGPQGGMDGLTATRELRDAHPEARIVIVTKHNDEATREAAFNHGACGFVPKENLLELRALIGAAASPTLATGDDHALFTR
ncbi:MAG: response regulator transcription factor, partial [Blastocatellia bacterium]